MINCVTLIGHLGQAPQIKRTKAGERYAILNMATSERWKDKATGERRERTDWHRVVIYGTPLVEMCEKWLAKGSKLYLEGRLSQRKWHVDEATAREMYVTDSCCRAPKARLIHLDRGPGERVPRSLTAPTHYGCRCLRRRPPDDLPL